MMAATQAVTVDNFVRAETDRYFASMVDEGGVGRLEHHRELVPIDKQVVVRTNRDTLYSQGVFDLDAGPVTVTLPDAKRRFRSMLVINEDHYALQTIYDPGSYRFTSDDIATRYLFLLIRTFVDPDDPNDVAAVHALQDATRVEQPAAGRFEVPSWDTASLKAVRDALAALPGFDPSRAFGRRDQVDSIHHMIGAARGWGGNPARDATYLFQSPLKNDGKTVYRLTVRDVPVDGFWSISVYNGNGFFEANPRGAYTLNSVTATPSPDGAYTIQFGDCGDGAPNCLPIMAGWNLTVRLYRPRREILEGTWAFPQAQEA